MKIVRVKSFVSPPIVRAHWSICLLAGLVASWLAPHVLAQSAGRVNPATTSTARLQSMVNATATQFKLAYRNNQREHDLRREQLVSAVRAWRGAARSEANNELMADWLQTAIRNSMPGSREPLPALPQFNQPPAPAPIAARQLQQSRDAQPQGATAQRVETKKTPAASQFEPTSETAPARSAQPAKSETSKIDFWSAHPANADLPANLSGGNPFQDDP